MFHDRCTLLILKKGGGDGRVKLYFYRFIVNSFQFNLTLFFWSCLWDSKIPWCFVSHKQTKKQNKKIKTTTIFLLLKLKDKKYLCGVMRQCLITQQWILTIDGNHNNLITHCSPPTRLIECLLIHNRFDLVTPAMIGWTIMGHTNMPRWWMETHTIWKVEMSPNHSNS